MEIIGKGGRVNRIEFRLESAKLRYSQKIFHAGGKPVKTELNEACIVFEDTQDVDTLINMLEELKSQYKYFNGEWGRDDEV